MHAGSTWGRHGSQSGQQQDNAVWFECNTWIAGLDWSANTTQGAYWGQPEKFSMLHWHTEHADWSQAGLNREKHLDILAQVQPGQGLHAADGSHEQILHAALVRMLSQGQPDSLLGLPAGSSAAVRQAVGASKVAGSLCSRPGSAVRDCMVGAKP